MSEKRRVPISSVEPSGQNPRQDFGDIEALARTIRATGGQPVNPIVVVEDGGVYRIVDGERRYRALLSLGAVMADVLVCDDWGEAEESVAMLATDDKKGLTEQERARGFQSMLALGVTDEVAGAAAGLAPDVVRRVRRVAREAPEQSTLDAMIAASEFEDPADRAKVLEAANPEAVAGRIRAEREDAASRAAVRSAAERSGAAVDWRDGRAPSRWAPREDGLRFRAFLSSESDAESAVGVEGAVAWPCGRGWDLWAPRAEDEPTADEDRERQERLRSASEAAFVELRSSLMRWASALGAVPRDLSSILLSARASAEALADVMGVPAGDADLAAALDSAPSPYEALAHIWEMRATFGVRTWSGDFSDEKASEWSDLWDACVQGGWDPTGCPDAAAELEAWLAECDGGES